MIICGVGGTPKDCGITKDSGHFAPRVGLAYRLTKSTVIRAGFGITTDPTFLGGTTGDRQNFPDILATTLPSPNSYSYATTLRLGLPVPVAPNYSSGTVAVPTTTGVFTVDNQNFVRGYVESWNFTVEQAFGGWTASAGYVATRSVDPISSLNENWSPVGTGTAGQVLNVLAKRTAITDTIGTMGTNKYDSLQSRVSHRFAKSYQLSAVYSYAKGMGYSTQVAIPSDFRLNYGRLASVAPQTLGLTGIVDAPFGKGKQWLQHGFGSKVLGGWQLDSVGTLRSGLPFTVTASNTTLNAVGSTQFANCITKPQELGSIYKFYDTSAFGVPTAGHFGNCGTNNLFGPRLINVDAGLARTFAITERFQLKFNAQMFNVANHPHHANPVSNINSSTFMQALAIANTGREGIDERTLLLSLRLGF